MLKIQCDITVATRNNVTDKFTTRLAFSYFLYPLFCRSWMIRHVGRLGMDQLESRNYIGYLAELRDIINLVVVGGFCAVYSTMH